MQKSLGRRLAAPLALGALLVTPASALAARVTVRVEGATSTLVPSTVVSLPTQPVGLPGKPRCSGASALAALDLAARGRWSGSYFDSFNSYLVDTIAGEKHRGASYLAFWTNLHEANAGVCAVRPRDGGQILFFVGGKKGLEPLELRAPKTVRAGRAFTVVVRRWSAKGVPSRVAHAMVSGAGGPVWTNAHGFVRLVGTRPLLRLRATAPGLVRSETDTVAVRSGDVSR